MAEEENDVIQQNDEEINKTQERITNLSSKVKEASTQRDDALKVADEAKREAGFYRDFADMIPKYQAASEYKDSIREKVMAGYSVEDATVAVLNAQGKLTPAAPLPPTPPAPAAGGSATYSPPQMADKPIHEMTRDEKRAQLVELEKRGDISLT